MEFDAILHEALTRHVVKAQLTRHTHTHSHMHTGKRQQTRHTRTQLPAGAIVANLASSAHALYALCIRSLHANRPGFPFKLFSFTFGRTIIKFYETATKLVTV